MKENNTEPNIGIISRDEMNLAEFPLTVLSTRAGTSAKTLEFSDNIQNKKGELVNRQWIITGADKFGLPTSSDDEVLLGLLKLTVDEGLKGRKIHFTRYELLKSLKWTTEGRNYSRLQKALDRLSGVRIKATNAFYDNETKSHSTKNFGIIDEYEINNGNDSDAKKCFFVWSDVLFKSFQVGFIKKLDLEFYLNLKSATSKRLYRYLDKHFWYRSTVRINLFTLAHEKIGVSRTYKFASSLRQQIDPALDELKACEFIEKYEYRGRGQASEVTIYAKIKSRGLNRGYTASTENVVTAENSKKNGSKDGLSTQQQIATMLIQRGLSQSQSIYLLKNKDNLELERIKKIIDHFDNLLTSQSSLVSKNSLGFLYKAVEFPDKFVLPNERQTNGKQSELNLRNRSTSTSQKDIQIKNTNTKHNNESLQIKYLTYRKYEIERVKNTLEKSVLNKITKEVEAALAKLKGLISDERFAEAVVHGTDEKIAKLFAVPEFDEWSRAD